MIEEIKNELLDVGLYDLFYFGWVIQVTSRHLDVSPTDPAVVEPALQAIAEMLETGHVIVGQTERDSEDLVYVRSWELSPDDAAHRIRKEWSALEGLPTPGQIAWFELTDAGRDEARRLGR